MSEGGGGRFGCGDSDRGRSKVKNGWDSWYTYIPICYVVTLSIHLHMAFWPNFEAGIPTRQSERVLTWEPHSPDRPLCDTQWQNQPSICKCHCSGWVVVTSGPAAGCSYSVSWRAVRSAVAHEALGRHTPSAIYGVGHLDDGRTGS